MVGTHRFWQVWGDQEVRGDEDEAEDLADIDALVFPRKFDRNPRVFVEDCTRNDEPDSAVTPRFQDPRWRAVEEDPGHEDVRVENDPHLRFRTARVADLTSERFIPARRA